MTTTTNTLVATRLTRRQLLTLTLERLIVPAASVLVAASVAAAGPRVLLAVALPMLLLGAVAHRMPCGVRAAVLLLIAAIALGAGVIVGGELLLLAAAPLFAVAGARAGWRVNRGRSRGRAWTYRLLAALAVLPAGLYVAFPVLQAVNFLAKPTHPVSDAALGLPHERVEFHASDGIRLSGWYVHGRKDAAIVLVHGGGGDREGAVRHARMLAGGGYGVLMYDARGRGESDGSQNAFGWEWHRDVRGAVDYLERRGVKRIGAFGLSTGAEAVVTEAAADPRVGAVVADGVQARRAADSAELPLGQRILLQPPTLLAEALIGLASGERPPAPLREVVRRVAATRPLLLIATISIERSSNRAYAEGTTTEVWELPETLHTAGLTEHPRAYADRVLSLFDEALG